MSNLGKEMKALEADCRRMEDQRVKNWKEMVRPVLLANVVDLEKRCAMLKATMESEESQGMEHMMRLEEELNKSVDALDAIKRTLNFPFQEIALGQGGVYLGLTDFWLEHAAGGFSLELFPDDNLPIVKLTLCGTRNNDKGVTARASLEGFELVGDKGKRVPNIKFNNLQVSMAFTVDILMSFDVQACKWDIDPKNFKLAIVAFKGPYGLNKR